MRTALFAFLLLSSGLPLAAAEPEIPAPPPPPLIDEPQPVQLGGGVVLPRAVFEQIMAREDGLAVIERMQQRAEDTGRFEGMPHLILIFACVLLFFWSAMFYYQRKHARLHRTIQLMIEKGVPLPPEILRAAEQFENGEHPASAGSKAQAPVWAHNLLWGGILWITIGITGILFLWFRDSEYWPWGIAAVVYGVAAAATALKKGSTPGPDPR